MVWAQVTPATLSGRVTDGVGDPLGGVEVKLQNLNTGDTHLVLTGDDGDYRVLELLPGGYMVEASLAGF